MCHHLSVQKAYMKIDRIIIKNKRNNNDIDIIKRQQNVINIQIKM